MRVENPLEYGTKLMAIEAPEDHYTPAKFESMFGGNEINLNFAHPIPVHLTYQTAFVDEDGKLQLRDDVYGRDAKMIAILKNPSERRVADIAIEHAPEPVRQAGAAAEPAPMPASSGQSYAYRSGPNFFDFLFGGGSAPIGRSRSIGPHANVGQQRHVTRR